MAQKDYIENWRGQADYIEIYRDDHSCRRRFKYREEEAEAEQYFSYLQSLDNQQQSLDKQKEIAEQLKRQNDLAEKRQNAYNTSNRAPYPFPQVSRQVLDPEYREWLQFKKETDPEYKKWRRQKELEAAKIRAEQERARQEAERKREQERIERERIEAERRRKQEEEERRLAPIRAKEAAARAKKEAEQRRIQEEKRKREQEEYQRKENVKTFFKWVFGLAALGGLIAVIVMWGKTILAIIFVVCLLIGVVSAIFS